MLIPINYKSKSYVHLLFAVLFSMFLNACGDSGDEEIDPAFNINPSDVYMPTTANTRWTYERTIFSTETYDMWIPGNTKDLNGKTYFEVMADIPLADDGNIYYAYQDGDYYENGNSSIFGNNYEWLYLKDDVPEGTEWIHDYNYNGTPNRYVMTILEKGVTKEVKEQVYENVIVVGLVQEVLFFSDWTTFATAETWYAKGVGLIYAEGFIGEEIELISYDIK